MTPMCPCGQKLHYASDDRRDRIEAFIATVGEDVQVPTPRGVAGPEEIHRAPRRNDSPAWPHRDSLIWPHQ